MLLFVYGSLLQGEENFYMLSGAQYVGEAQTKALFTLINLGPYPALVEGGKTEVYGELYEVSDELMVLLDEFEGTPDHYERKIIETNTGLMVHTYVAPNAKAAAFPIVASGNWRSR